MDPAARNPVHPSCVHAHDNVRTPITVRGLVIAIFVCGFALTIENYVTIVESAATTRSLVEGYRRFVGFKQTSRCLREFWTTKDLRLSDGWFSQTATRDRFVAINAVRRFVRSTLRSVDTSFGRHFVQSTLRSVDTSFSRHFVRSFGRSTLHSFDTLFVQLRSFDTSLVQLLLQRRLRTSEPMPATCD